jgi:hypothetical protein
MQTIATVQFVPCTGGWLAKASGRSAVYVGRGADLSSAALQLRVAVANEAPDVRDYVVALIDDVLLSDGILPPA